MKSSSAPERHDDELTKYKGVRKRKWGKWVSEIRLPNSRERIWLGSYDSPEKAARAFDAALFCLRGRHAKFNFPDTPPDIPGGNRLSPAEIQAAASRFAAAAAADQPRSHSDSEVQRGNNSHSPSPSPSEGGGYASLDVRDRAIWDDTVGSTNYDTNIIDNYLNCNYGYDNGNGFPGHGSGSDYPAEYGIFQGFDDLSTDFYAPTVDNSAEENYDTSLNHGSFLWNF